MLHHCRWYLYANCSTNNPNITRSWQISIDPIFQSSAPAKAPAAAQRSGKTKKMLADLISLGRTVLPTLMELVTRAHFSSAPSAPTMSSTMNVYITPFLEAQGVTGLNPAPLDPNDLSQGPSNFPFKSTEIGVRCQEYFSGEPLQCQCQTQVSWLVAEQGAFVTYKGPVP